MLHGEIHFIVYISVCQLGAFELQGGQGTVLVFEEIMLLKTIKDTQEQARLAKQLLGDNVASANIAEG